MKLIVRKSLAVIVVIGMVLALLPVDVFAEQTEDALRAPQNLTGAAFGQADSMQNGHQMNQGVPITLTADDLDTAELFVEKVYDAGRSSDHAVVKGKAYVRGTNQKVEVIYTGLGEFSDHRPGSGNITVRFGELRGEGADGYVLANGSVEVGGIRALITRAKTRYPYDRKEFSVQEGQDFSGPLVELAYFGNNKGLGIGTETFDVVPEYFRDLAAQDPLDAEAQWNLSAGRHSIYVKLTPVLPFREMYEPLMLPYPIQLTVIGLPKRQQMSWKESGDLQSGVLHKNYGDDNFFFLAETQSGGGSIVYTSSNTEVAVVDADTGEVTVTAWERRP